MESPPVLRAMARSAVYRCLSLACGYPTAERVQALREEALPTARAATLIACKALTPQLAVLTRQLDGAKHGELRSQYHAALGHLPLPDCPAYETGYLGKDVFRQTNVMADVGGFYRAFGVRVGRGEHERIDHVTTELEFMRFLTHKEARARVHHGRAQVDICRRAQRRFWREHLGPWLPTFALLLAKSAQRGFYGDLALGLATFAEAESRILGKTAIAMEISSDPQTFDEMDCSIDADACPLSGVEARATP